MKTTHKISLIILGTAIIFGLTGCSFDQQIFEQEEDPYLQVPVDKTELEEKVYYVKNGTKFYKTFEAPSLGNSTTNEAILYLNDSERAVPIYYKGEYIAIASTEDIDFTKDMVRYLDYGYSIGMDNLNATDGGYMCGSHNIVPESSLYNIISSEAETPKSITFSKINGKYLNDKTISKEGIVLGLTKNEDYTVGYFIGSYYKEAVITADTRFLIPFEHYDIDYSLTDSGYSIVKLPEDAKSGYYAINNNVFKYYDRERSGMVSENSVNMNEPYFVNQQDSVYSDSQQYSFVLDTEKKNMQVTISYELDTSNEEDGDNQSKTNNPIIQAILTAPNGIKYDMKDDNTKSTISSKIEVAMAGEWVVNIVPRELSVTNIDVQSDDGQQEATENEYRFHFNEEMSNVKFFVNYEGVGDVHAIIITPVGMTYDFDLSNEVMGEAENTNSDRQKNTLSYVMPYVPAGEYTVKVYHYTNTEIRDVSYETNTGNETDIISITG